MTFSAMQTNLQVICDKAGTGYFTPSEMDLYLNEAQNEYVELCYNNFEKDERMRDELNPIVVGPTTVTSTTTVNLSGIANYKYMLSVSAIIPTVDFFGNSTGTVNVSVQPRNIDKYMKNLTNSFTKPTANDPVYEQYLNGSNQKVIVVNAGGVTPNSISYLYLKIPTVIDGNGTPSGNADFSDAVCLKIIDIAARKMLGTIENEQRVQTQQLEISQSQTI